MATVLSFDTALYVEVVEAWHKEAAQIAYTRARYGDSTRRLSELRPILECQIYVCSKGSFGRFQLNKVSHVCGDGF